MQDNTSVDDVWDDTLVMKTWEESMRLAKEDVAKRIANSTNKIVQEEGAAQDSHVDTSAGERKLDWEPVSHVLRPGDFCRATYTDDGVDYEAVIVSVADDGQKRCLIKFLGYGNEQRTPMKDLIASWGEEFRVAQIEAATAEAGVSTDEVDSNASTINSDREFETPVAVGDTRTRRKSNQKRKSRNPCPPMPPMPPTGDDNLHAMLMAWYMSGYYTGVYDAQQKSQKK